MENQKDQLIIKQALEIEEYKTKLAKNAKILETLKGRFISIGQPLNDNLLGFTVSQRSWASEVYSLISELN